MSHQGVGRERLGRRSQGRGRMRTMSFSASMSAQILKVDMEKQRNTANVEQVVIASTEPDDLKAMSSGSLSVPTQESVVKKLPTTI